MNEQEKGIIEDTIESIKQLVVFTIKEISANNYTTEKTYNLCRYALEIGEDTIEELEKVKNGEYEKSKEGLCKGE